LELDDWLRAEEEILRAHMDALVDEASEESFPASDSERTALGNSPPYRSTT
jgi:hypothetical protein